MNSLGLISIVLWLGLGGLAAYVAGLFSLLNSPITLLILLVLTIKIISKIRQHTIIVNPLTNLEKALLVIICLQLAFHGLGVFIPETSFDALWYHLPEASVYNSTGKIAKIPDLLYSTMPRLGEMYLALAMFSHKEVVVKVVSYLISILFIITCFLVARFFLSRPQSLLIVLILLSFPLIGWQSTAAYIDLTRALFELASLYCLLRFLSDYRAIRLAINPWFLYSALLTGFALSTKIHSLIHLSVMTLLLFLFLIKNNSFKISLLLVSCYLIIAGVIASPWYLDNYLNSGHPLYPLNLQEKRLDQLNHAGSNNSFEWVSSQLIHLPLIPVYLSHPRQQLSPLILFLFPS
jgi:4-amino-4-deoxy-L-arabinose transferase-like glycosyltransferase